MLELIVAALIGGAFNYAGTVTAQHLENRNIREVLSQRTVPLPQSVLEPLVNEERYINERLLLDPALQAVRVR